MELTKEQKEIINDQEQRRVFLDSASGTGKTTVMKTRAKKLADENPDKKVLFVICGGETEGLMQMTEMEMFFKDAENVSVLRSDDLKRDFSQGIQFWIDKQISSGCVGIFWDGFRGFSGKDLMADEVFYLLYPINNDLYNA